MNRPPSERPHQTVVRNLTNLILLAGHGDSIPRQSLRNGQQRGTRQIRFQQHRVRGGQR